jgi:ribosomal protein S18 acetylase RimI-like enzyme
VANIRPLETADLPTVTALLEERLPGWTGDIEFLEQTLVEYPWHDPELASLVAEDENGDILGFIGAQARRLELDGHSVRGVCCSHLVVVGDRRAGAAGALLLRRLLSGPQDLTWTDSATDVVVRIWNAFGGSRDHPRACDWMLALRTPRWAGKGLAAAVRRRKVDRELAPVAALPIQAAGPRAARPAFPATPQDVTSESAPVATIVDQVPSVTKGLRLRVAYDESHLTHLFATIRRTLGPVDARIVHRGGEPIGWYAIVRPSTGVVTRVLHLSALPTQVDSVVGELVERARDSGSAVLAGRFEPHLGEPLRHRWAVMGLARRPMLHTRDPEILALLATSSSLLTRLDGEWYVT